MKKRVRPVGEVATLYDSLHKTPSEYSEEGYPMLRVTDIRRGFLDTANTKRVDRGTYLEFSKKHRPQIGDILYSRVGSYGNSCFVDRNEEICLGQNTVCIGPNRNLIDPYFLYCCLNSEFVASQVESFVGGASQPTLSLKSIKLLEVPCPDLPTQRKIAGILSAYDDLIENNQRRIKILEEMAQSLYREWFVHFRFPGHESARFTASPLGQIPEGWEVKPLFEVATVKYGKMLPKKDLAEDGPFPVYGAAKVIGRHTSFTREDRTIICGCRGSVGEMQITEPRCFVTNNSFTFDPVFPNIYFWLFYTLSARGLRDVTGGAAQPQITLDGISQVYLGVPPEFILAEFEKRSRVLAELAWNLKSKNQTLRRTRDLLLPKLLSPA